VIKDAKSNEFGWKRILLRTSAEMKKKENDRC
jgi:hypothetical protein